MRIIFAGTSDFGLKALKNLSDQFGVCLVITQPDRQRGRGRKVLSTPVKEAAGKLGIPVFQPDNINTPESRERIRQEQPDLLITAAYGQFLSSKVINIPKYKCINIHGSLLPSYRGAAPVNYAILNGDKKTGISIFFMVNKMDAGPILLDREIAIEDDDNFGSLYEKLSDNSADAVIEAIEMIRDGNCKAVEQEHGKASFAPKIVKDDLIIDWSRKAEEIHNQVRAFAPKPLTYTTLNNSKVKICKTTIVSDDEELVIDNGEVYEIDKSGIYVNCGPGQIRIEILKPENKKEMSAYSFYAGRKIKVGDRFE